MMKKFFEIILIPFEFTGGILMWLGDLFRSFFNKFFLSVWGIIIPFAILLAIVMAFFVAQNQRELAAEYAAQLMVCEDDDIDRLVGILQNLEVAGLIELVNCLRSDREKIFFACQDAIETELQKLSNLTDEKKRDKTYLSITGAMLQQTPQFKPIAKNAVNQFVRQIMTDLINFESNGRSHDSQLVTLNCERIQAIIEPALNRGKGGDGVLQKPLTKTITRYNSAGFHDELLAADGQPFKQSVQNKNESLNDLEYIVSNNPPQKNNSPTFNNSTLLNTPNRSNFSETNRNEILVAQKVSSGLSTDMYKPSERQNSFPLLPELGNSRDKVANQYFPNEKNMNREMESGTNFDSRAGGRVSPEARSDLYYGSDNFFGRSDVADNFLPDNLRNIKLNRLPSLPTVQLMRLLQHSDSKYVLEARRVLIARDGFGEAHLGLAYKLYHKNPAIRKEVIAHLSETSGVLANAWLTELLGDPNDEIRYNAAALLSTSTDPNTRKFLIEKCKYDTDTRIVNLINQLRQR
ncbi:MAG: HEAT repeat domain-containing protein [Planctomycetaceae bacterium]|nr:HEAT repeat domain-containing protein [Planctomycetaceae bacterium]